VKSEGRLWVPSSILYSVYRSYCDARGYGHAGESVVARLVARQPWVERRVIRFNGKPTRCTSGIPGLVEPVQEPLPDHPNVQRFATIMGVDL
jgi:hypothetical protein